MLSQDKKNQEKKALIIGFALILLVVLVAFTKPYFNKDRKASNGAASQNKIQDYPQISSSDLEAKMRNKENLQIVDIRTNDFYGAEHIIDSLNIPLEDLGKSNIAADPNKLIVILSEGSEEDKANEYQAIQSIKSEGFSDVKALMGGMISWKNSYGQTISWGNPDSFIDHSKITFISPEDLKKYIANNNPTVILDVRSSLSFAEGHIANAINIPLNDLEKRRNEMHLAKNIAVYGDTEFQGFQAGVRLYDLSFLSVQVLKGGFSAWKDKKLEIVK